MALDFQWNQFNRTRRLSDVNGNQFALALLARVQYPLMGDESFTRGRLVPFLMAGPAVVWTTANSKILAAVTTSTDFGIVAELGLEYFIIPQLSVGPSFRYRHIFGPSGNVR